MNPAAQTYHGQHVELVRPGQAGRGGQQPARPGRRRDHPAPGLHQDDHQDGRGRRRVDRRLPRRRLGAGPQGLAHRLGVGLGTALRRHRQDRAGRRLHRLASTTPTTGSACKTGDNPFVQSKYGPSVDGRDQGPDRHGQGRHRPTDRLAVQGPGHRPGRQGHLRRRHHARLRGHRRPRRSSSRASSASSRSADADRAPDPRRRHPALPVALRRRPRPRPAGAGGGRGARRGWRPARSTPTRSLGGLRTAAKVVRDAGGVGGACCTHTVAPAPPASPRRRARRATWPITIAAGDVVVDCGGMSAVLRQRARRRAPPAGRSTGSAVGGLGLESAGGLHAAARPTTGATSASP